VRAFRSRSFGQRHLSFGDWFVCVVFAAGLPSVVGLIVAIVSPFFGAEVPTDKGVWVTFGELAVFAALIMVLSLLPICVFSLAGVLLLRLGWAGWASALLAGGVITLVPGIAIFRQPEWGLLGAIYGFTFWLGLARYVPDALRESPSER